jgi:hypothetical protein
MPPRRTAEKRDDIATVSWRALPEVQDHAAPIHPIPHLSMGVWGIGTGSDEEFCPKRIGEAASGSMGAILQPASRWRRQPTSEMGHRRRSSPLSPQGLSNRTRRSGIGVPLVCQEETSQSSLYWRTQSHWRCRFDYLSAVCTLVKVVFSLEPTPFKTAMTATAMPLAMRPYSIRLPPIHRAKTLSAWSLPQRQGVIDCQYFVLVLSGFSSQESTV